MAVIQKSNCEISSTGSSKIRQRSKQRRHKERCDQEAIQSVEPQLQEEFNCLRQLNGEEKEREQDTVVLHCQEKAPFTSYATQSISETETTDCYHRISDRQKELPLLNPNLKLAALFKKSQKLMEQGDSQANYQPPSLAGELTKTLPTITTTDTEATTPINNEIRTVEIKSALSTPHATKKSTPAPPLPVPSYPERSLPPLHAALYQCVSLPEIYAQLAAAKLHPAALAHRDEEFGNTPLHVACLAPQFVTFGMSQQEQQQHPYCSADSLRLVIPLIHHLCPKNMQRTNHAGELPLHLIVASALCVLSSSSSSSSKTSINDDYRDDETTSCCSKTIHVSNDSTGNVRNPWLDICTEVILEYPQGLWVRNENGDRPLDLVLPAAKECPELVALIQQETALVEDHMIRSLGDDRPPRLSSIPNQCCSGASCLATMNKFQNVSQTIQMTTLDSDTAGVLFNDGEDTFEDEEAVGTPGYVSPNDAIKKIPLCSETNSVNYGRGEGLSRFVFFQRLKCPWATGFVIQKASVVAASLLMLAGLILFTQPATHRNIRVAFIGNSITFVNDLPRFMEAISNGHISQDSCLHGATRLRTLLNTGNGMYNKWQTDNSFIKNITEEDDLYAYVAQRDDDGNDGFVVGDPHPIYDFGACSVPELLLGHDKTMQMYNANGKYRDDGKNACIQDPIYYAYREERYLELLEEQKGSQLYLWDYVVMNDQTNVPAIAEERERSEQVLKYVYAPYLQQIKAKPILLMTHAYSYNASVSFDSDYDDIWQDVPTFTSALYYGYQRYSKILTQELPWSQAPKIAPAGLAFLTIWEENHSMWKKLFFVDGFHPTPHGTFLIGCVLYATVYQRMPANIPTQVEDLFSRARRMHIGLSDDDDDEYTMPTPTLDEAIYLASIAERVTLRNYLPKTLDTSFRQ